MPSERFAVSCRIKASAISTSRNPRTRVSGSLSAASTGGITAFSAATTTATRSAPQKLWTSTPGKAQDATINATPVASHETASGNNRRRGRSGRHAVDLPYDGSEPLGMTRRYRRMPAAGVTRIV